LSQLETRSPRALPALGSVVLSALAGLTTLELVRRARFEAARYGASAAVGFVVVGWGLAQRPELLPGLTVEEAAAGRATLLATVLGVAAGAVVLVPSLTLLFGLVLRGRFDGTAAPAVAAARGDAASGRLLGRVALVLGGLGVPLTLLVESGPLLGAGVVLLLGSVALAWVAFVAVAAVDPDDGPP